MNHLFSRYRSPSQSDGVVRALAEDDAAVVVAGGTVVLAADRRAPGSVDTVVDLSRAGLHRLHESAGEFSIGAMVTYRQLLASEEIARRVPLLATAAAGITGGPQIRNRGTIGGSACNANPASDMPAVLVALDATMVILGPDGERQIPAENFFLGAFSAAIDSNEVLTEMRIPIAPACRRVGYWKLKLSEGSWPLVTAAVIERGGYARLTLGAVTPRPTPIDLPAAIDELERYAVEELVDVAVTTAGAWSDELATASYRQRVAGVTAWRAITEARAYEAPEGKESG